SCRISPSLSFLVSSLATTGLSSLSLHDALPIYVQALRAIWTAWNAGERLAFRGEFYSHTLMTPFFSPGPNPYGPPAVYLAAVGEDRKRTRLNSSHVKISYAVFCLKKKIEKHTCQ